MSRQAKRRRTCRVRATALGVFLSLVATESVAATRPSEAVPGAHWQYDIHPEKDGWNRAELDALRAYLVKDTQITGFMIVFRGQVIFEYGDVQENSYIASCRKSILAMLFGRYVQTGQINLDKPIGQIGMDDVGGLLPIEKTARIRDIISARSGVFHAASNPGDYLDNAPTQGSIAPGSYWLYSNWDFNAAGYIFEHETHRDIYDEVDQRLARPLQMQDWHRAQQHKESHPELSRYGAYPMWISTRDMARLGLLMLNHGTWAGKTILDSRWVDEMVKPRTSCAEVNAHIPAYRSAPFCLGYGYMWWLWEKAPDPKMVGGYSALGSLGQSITVFPAMDTVIAYKTKEAYERETPFEARFRVLMMTAAAFKAGSAATPLDR